MWSGILYVFIFFIAVVASIVIVQGMRTRGSIARSLAMSFFCVKTSNKNSSNQKEIEFIEKMERLYSSFSNINVKGWNRFLYGEPYICLEVFIDKEEKIPKFIIGVPRMYAGLFGRKIRDVFEEVSLEEVWGHDYFMAQGALAGSFITLSEHPMLPIHTYHTLHSLPLYRLIESLSRLEKDNDRAALQVLIKPAHRPIGFPKTYDEAIIRKMHLKASKQLFESNIRLLVSTDTKARSHELLKDLSRVFENFKSLNYFKINNLHGRLLKDLKFSFMFRMYKSNQSTILSSEELAGIFHLPHRAIHGQKLTIHEKYN